MAFKYDPKLAIPCLPSGNYTAILMAVVAGKSRKGLPMLTLDFDVIDGDRRCRVRTWIANPTSLYLLKELAEAVDQSEAFTAGTFDPQQFLGCEVLVQLRVIQTDMFGDHNNIGHYYRANPDQPIKRHADASGATIVTPTNIADDDIPF